MSAPDRFPPTVPLDAYTPDPRGEWFRFWRALFVGCAFCLLLWIGFAAVAWSLLSGGAKSAERAAPHMVFLAPASPICPEGLEPYRRNLRWPPACARRV